MNIRSIGIIGYGNFGACVETLLKRFAPSVQIRVYSLDREPDGKLFFSIDAVAACDAVVLAVPIVAIEETLEKLLPLMRPDGVIVDVATVKVHTAKLLKRLAKGHAYIATHPMFGPESYEKRNGNITGFRIVVAAHTLSANAYMVLKAFATDLGFSVVEMTPDAHDKLLAETLFLTHFIGQIVERSGFRRTDIDTVSFGFLMDAVESVRRDTKLFRDVFRFNPFCAKVLRRFEKAEQKVHKLLSKGSKE